MDSQTAGYLARSAFARARAVKQASFGSAVAHVARHTGTGAVTGAAAGALNDDGQTSLGQRALRGAVGGAVAAGALGGVAFPLLGKGYHATAKKLWDPTRKPIPARPKLEQRIVGGVLGVFGGTANTV
jgi:hypothetical protein